VAQKQRPVAGAEPACRGVGVDDAGALIEQDHAGGETVQHVEDGLLQRPIAFHLETELDRAAHMRHESTEDLSLVSAEGPLPRGAAQIEGGVKSVFGYEGNHRVVRYILGLQNLLEKRALTASPKGRRPRPRTRSVRPAETPSRRSAGSEYAEPDRLCSNRLAAVRCA